MWSRHFPKIPERKGAKTKYCLALCTDENKKITKRFNSLMRKNKSGGMLRRQSQHELIKPDLFEKKKALIFV